MKIGVVATLRIADDKIDDFETTFRDLTAQVKASEQGNEMYSLFRSKLDPSTYVVMEVYTDQSAVDAHNKTDHFRAAMRKIGSMLAGPADIKFFEQVVSALIGVDRRMHSGASTSDEG